MDDVREMLAAINLAIEEGDVSLSEWEEGLLESVRRLLSEGRPLTGPQDAAFEGIWKRATGQS